MNPKIVVVGSYNVDFIFQVNRFPAPGETVPSETVNRHHGGKGANQAVAAARLGADVQFIANVGNDMFGHSAIEFLQKQGVGTDFVKLDPNRPTGTASVYVDHAGDNMISLSLGANKNLSPAAVEAAEEIIAEADFLLTQLETPVATAQSALSIARRNGVRTILNPAPAIKASMDLMAYADIITPNEIEMDQIYGDIDFLDADAAAYMLASESQIIVMTLGPQGARWITRDDTMGIQGFGVDTIDTTGAGDCFCGALAVGLAEGFDLSDAVRFANAAAALSTTRTGAAKSMPRREAVQELLITG